MAQQITVHHTLLTPTGNKTKSVPPTRDDKYQTKHYDTGNNTKFTLDQKL